MACEVCWTAHARADAEGIVAYIAQTLASPRAAAEHLDAFEDAVERIAGMPELYAVSQQASLRSRGLRPCFVKGYVLPYSFDGERVLIHRVFSTRRDYARCIERQN